MYCDSFVKCGMVWRGERCSTMSSVALTTPSSAMQCSAMQCDVKQCRLAQHSVALFDIGAHCVQDSHSKH